MIGRNEGTRLERCLAGVLRTGVPVAYADSGSTDDSVTHARSTGALVVELDPSRPFSAARGRNEGFAALLAAVPELEFVQFVDGDSELDPGWLDVGVAALLEHPDWVLVCGVLRERAPGASVYNRLCQLEWDEPTGAISGCGGIFMARRGAFEAVGGFDTSLISSEERELCTRLAAGGGKFFRLESAMAHHDADMQHFGEWWTRQQRCGYGDLDSALRFSQNLRRVASVWLWSCGWLVASILTIFAAGTRLGARGAFVTALVALMLPIVQAARIAWTSRSEGRTFADVLSLGLFLMLAKWPRLHGHLHYLRDRLRGGPLRLIEYRGQ